MQKKLKLTQDLQRKMLRYLSRRAQTFEKQCWISKHVKIKRQYVHIMLITFFHKQIKFALAEIKPPGLVHGLFVF